MGVEDAVAAAQLVKTEKVIGVHYDTFGFIKIDKANSIELFEKESIQLLLPEIGINFEI